MSRKMKICVRLALQPFLLIKISHHIVTVWLLKSAKDITCVHITVHSLLLANWLPSKNYFYVKSWTKWELSVHLCTMRKKQIKERTQATLPATVTFVCVLHRFFLINNQPLFPGIDITTEEHLTVIITERIKSVVASLLGSEITAVSTSIVFSKSDFLEIQNVSTFSCIVWKTWIRMEAFDRCTINTFPLLTEYTPSSLKEEQS